MIKKYTINKICVTSVSLFLILMFYLVPSTPESEVKIEIAKDGEKRPTDKVYIKEIEVLQILNKGIK